MPVLALISRPAQLELNTTLQVKVTTLERKLLDSAVAIANAPAREMPLPNSPVRKIESLNIRIEALRTRTVDLESRLAASAQARQEAERDLRCVESMHILVKLMYCRILTQSTTEERNKFKSEVIVRYDFTLINSV